MEQKILQYEGPVRNEEIVLKVASYAYGNQLFVGMMRPGEEEESYGDRTLIGSIKLSLSANISLGEFGEE